MVIPSRDSKKLCRAMACEPHLVGWVALNGWRERKGLSRHRKQLELRVRQEVLGVYRAEVHCS